MGVGRRQAGAGVWRGADRYGAPARDRWAVAEPACAQAWRGGPRLGGRGRWWDRPGGPGIPSSMRLRESREPGGHEQWRVAKRWLAWAPLLWAGAASTAATRMRVCAAAWA